MGKEELKQAVIAAKNMLFNDPEMKTKLEDLTHISGAKDFLNTFPLLWWLLKRVVYVVEVVTVEFNQCSHEERLDVAAELLDELITFKGWLALFEPFDGLLFRLLLSAAVQALNDWLGHDWLAHAKKVSTAEKYVANLG